MNQHLPELIKPRITIEYVEVFWPKNPNDEILDPYTKMNQGITIVLINTASLNYKKAIKNYITSQLLT